MRIEQTISRQYIFRELADKVDAGKARPVAVGVVVVRYELHDSRDEDFFYEILDTKSKPIHRSVPAGDAIALVLRCVEATKFEPLILLVKARQALQQELDRKRIEEILAGAK